MSDLALVYAVFPDHATAHSRARQLIGENLAACVNILAPCTSVYRWQGKIEENTEVPALFKTSIQRCGALVKRIEELHPYDVPAIVSWPAAEAPAAFAQWITDSMMD